MSISNDDLVKMTVEVAIASVSAPGATNYPLTQHTDTVMNYMQAVYDKLKELNAQA